jgi:hypothetical protein
MQIQEAPRRFAKIFSRRQIAEGGGMMADGLQI